MFILIAYDITNNKRLRKVARLMESYGTRVQRSVFECVLNHKELIELAGKVKSIMKRREDKVQIYLLCDACLERSDQCTHGGLGPEAETYIV